MWHDHPSSQRNKTSKIAVGEGRKQHSNIEGFDKILKKWVVNIGGVLITREC